MPTKKHKKNWNTIEEYALKERHKQLDFNMSFCRIFGVSLFEFFPNVLLGFDVIKFDKWIAPKKNESTYEAIERKFGKDAVTLIKKLIA